MKLRTSNFSLTISDLCTSWSGTEGAVLLEITRPPVFCARPPFLLWLGFDVEEVAVSYVPGPGVSSIVPNAPSLGASDRKSALPASLSLSVGRWEGTSYAPVFTDEGRIEHRSLNLFFPHAGPTFGTHLAQAPLPGPVLSLIERKGAPVSWISRSSQRGPAHRPLA